MSQYLTPIFLSAQNYKETPGVMVKYYMTGKYHTTITHRCTLVGKLSINGEGQGR